MLFYNTINPATRDAVIKARAERGKALGEVWGYLTKRR